jgi:hypothetical protein
MKVKVSITKIMNNKYAVAIAVAVALVVGGYLGASYGRPQTGRDFAGGNLPSQVLTGSASGGVSGNGYVQPVGSLTLAGPNGLAVGGTNQYHGLTSYNAASGTPAAAATLGPFGSTTSTASTSITLPDTVGLSIGAICNGGAATTTIYVSGCALASTNGATGTATVYYNNGTGAALTVPTSTVFRISFDQTAF